MIGVLAGAGAAPLLVATMGGGRPGYGAMALVIAAVCAVAMTGPIVMLRGRDRSAIKDGRPRQHLFSQLAAALHHPRFRLLIGAYIALLTGVSVVSAAIPYLVVKAFHRAEGDIGVAMCAMLAATILAVPAWSWAGRRWGETRALGLAGLAFVASSAALGLAASATLAWPLALGLFAVAGLPFAGLQVLPYTLVAHLINEENRHGRGGDEGVFTGVWTAAEKLGLAFGPALTGMALMLNRQDIAQGLAFFVSVVPGLLALLSLPFLFAAARGPSRLPEFSA
jgi:Na+/melibiose symporter-like transporter